MTLDLPTPSAGDVPHHVIRRIRMAHCKRGPEICQACQEAGSGRLCLLALHPPHAGLMQRRLIQIEEEGREVWRAFEVLRVFEDEQEARTYARERGITDIQV